MADNTKNYYDSEYYRTHCGDEYERGNGWEEIFGNYADRVVKEIAPKKTLDVGCAKGFFVEALRDRGVDAYGIDISDYAISEVREDIKPFCKVKSALLPIEDKYDLITCIEVLEHLEGRDIPLAIQRMCEATDDIIFSSTPFDYNEESHISVHSPAYWVEQFAYNGFYRDVQYDCSYIAVQTMRFRRGNKDKFELIREYENEIFGKTQEIVAVRHNYQMSVEQVEIYKDAYQKHVDIINKELNPKICELEKEICSLKDENQNPVLIELKNELQMFKDVTKNPDILERDSRISSLNKEIQELENRIKTLQKEKEEVKSGVDKAYRGQLERQVDVRKLYEEMLAQSEKQINQLKKEVSVVKEQEFFLRGVGVKDLIKWKRNKKRADKELLGKDRGYWIPVFDAEYYAKNNKDVSDAVGTSDKALLEHFIVHGMNEGRPGNSVFDPDKYCIFNPDIQPLCMIDKREVYIHYLNLGIKENRRIN